jgi:excisionase family DNA binding protein
MGERILLTIQEVAELTGFTVGTLYHFVSQRRIPVVRICRSIRFEKAALEAWIAEMAVPADSTDATDIARDKRDGDNRLRKRNC